VVVLAHFPSPTSPGMFTALFKLFQEPKYIENKDAETNNPCYGLTAVDYEEQNAGYQAALLTGRCFRVGTL
jgi:hypothetical protein